MPHPIKILIVEDSSADAELLVRSLCHAGFEPDWQRVDTEAAFLEHLHDGLDLVLSDSQMPQFSGLRALEVLKQHGLEVPFIIVSGTISEDTAVAAMKLGAADYLLKGQLARLESAVSHALESSRLHAEHRNIEEQLRQAQKMEAIGTLAGGIAHDFNNILTAIMGYTELAQMKLKENSEVRVHLGAILQASKRATDLVRQILTFSRQQPLERRPIHLQPVITESLELLRSTIPSTIEFDTSLASDVPTVLADATQIHQILMNLGTNAWNAMKDRPGQIQVKLEKYLVDETFAATQAQLKPGDYARLSVRDTGCGMDLATVQRAFEPFFTTRPRCGGTGLGLSVLHGIMKNHDGAVTVHSQPGEGTIFYLYFPAHAGEATTAAVEQGAVPRGHGEQVLFVDDEDVLVHLGQNALAALGYEVKITTQPAAALAMVRADPLRFALVLTDQTMPVMTGFDLAIQLLQIRPELPIILMTGYSASLTAAQVEAAGIRQLLLKPATLHSLGTAMQAALSLKAMP
ncbi:MAG TPA: response regulator [Opitutaceae bacterium]|jgi:signal transduction histidine kinase|nr:response regulator [Opitutaceae bacterium]